MIDIKILNENHVGRWVKYQPRSNHVERGRIKSWNDKYIFVVYSCAGQWGKFRNYTAAATNPAQLEFV